MASENENLTQSIRPKSEILGTRLSDPHCRYPFVLDFFFGKHIYRLNSPLTAVDPVDPQIPSRPNPPGSVSLWFYAVHRAYS